jgi:hypothetical protein
MKKLQSPYLELSFYFKDSSEKDDLSRVVNQLIESGASFSGKGWIHNETDINEKPFSSLSDLERSEVEINSIDEFNFNLTNLNTRLIEVDFIYKPANEEDSVIKVSYVGIPDIYIYIC